MKQKTLGIILIIFTIIVWGTTFLATKELLISFTASEIILYRFIIAFLALFLFKPVIFKWQGFKFEGLCFLANILGVGLYQYLENLSVLYSTPTNTSIIIACAAFFTALFTFVILKEQKPKIHFFIGFVISIVGIALVVLNGTLNLSLNPLGDFIALICAVFWGLYSVVVKIISKEGKPIILVTRRLMLDAVITITIIILIKREALNLSALLEFKNAAWTLYLGLIASAICFITWNYAVEHVGTVETSLAVYVIPLVTCIAGVLWFDEILTPMCLIGILVTIIGLYISSDLYIITNFINKRKELTK